VPSSSLAITSLLHSAAAGDSAAQEQLLRAVYTELKRIAARLLTQDNARRFIAPTELVNDAAMRLLDLSSISWQDRRHFFAMSARVMRQVLIDEVRRARADKRAHQPVTLVTAMVDEQQVANTPDIDVEALDDALTQLAAVSEMHAKVVELRFFAGLTTEEIAGVLGSSESTVKRAWRSARAWLADHMSPVS
jgi:RNA polymerase sigma factor (TIGR02999 family)